MSTVAWRLGLQFASLCEGNECKLFSKERFRHCAQNSWSSRSNFGICEYNAAIRNKFVRKVASRNESSSRGQRLPDTMHRNALAQASDHKQNAQPNNRSAGEMLKQQFVQSLASTCRENSKQRIKAKRKDIDTNFPKNSRYLSAKMECSMWPNLRVGHSPHLRKRHRLNDFVANGPVD